MRKDESGSSWNFDWLDSSRSLKIRNEKKYVWGRKCNGCHWWWLNISEDVWRKSELSSNKSRKNCAHSDFFLMFECQIEGRENALPTNRRKRWWVLHTKSIRDTGSLFSLIRIFASGIERCNYHTCTSFQSKRFSSFLI